MILGSNINKGPGPNFFQEFMALLVDFFHCTRPDRFANDSIVLSMELPNYTLSLCPTNFGNYQDLEHRVVQAGII